MKAKGVFLVTPGFLAPEDSRAKEILAALPVGKKVLAWVHTARYPEHHRLAFAVLQKIAEAIGSPVEVVLLWIKHETGRFDFVRLPDGRTEKAPHSIAFESMSQEDFQSFWNDALEVVKEKVLTKVDAKTFNELRDMIAGKIG